MDHAERRQQFREARQAQRERLAPHEEWVLEHADCERAVLFDAAGRIVTRKDGRIGDVLWTEAAVGPLLGRIDLVLHNHPGGTSLSEDDLDFALFLNVRELHVVTATKRYRLSRKGDTWGDERTLLQSIILERDQLVQEMVRARDAGKIDDAQIERSFNDALWSRVATRLPNVLRHEVESRE